MGDRFVLFEFRRPEPGDHLHPAWPVPGPDSRQILQEELGSVPLNRANNEGAIKKIVLLFAARLGNQQAAVTGGTEQESPLVRAFGRVLSADRIVRAKSPKVQRGSDRVRNAATDFDQASEGPFSV